MNDNSLCGGSPGFFRGLALYGQAQHFHSSRVLPVFDKSNILAGGWIEPYLATMALYLRRSRGMKDGISGNHYPMLVGGCEEPLGMMGELCARLNLKTAIEKVKTTTTILRRPNLLTARQSLRGVPAWGVRRPRKSTKIAPPLPIASMSRHAPRNRGLTWFRGHGKVKAKAVTSLFALAHNLIRKAALAPDFLVLGITTFASPGFATG